LPAVALGFITYFYLDDRPTSARWLTADERKLITEDFAKEEKQLASGGASHHLGEMFRHGSVWLLSFINLAIVVSLYGVTFWLPQIVKNLGVKNAFYIGLITAIPSALAAVAMVLVAKHSDHTGERRWHIVGCALVTTAGLVLSALYSGNPWISMTGLSLALMGILSGFTILFTIPGQLLSGTAIAAGIALMTSVGNLGGYFGPFVVGWIKDHTGHLEYALLAFAGLSIVGAIMVALLPGLARLSVKRAIP
jgi:nitrate/nitrite transporter NarK